MQHSKGLSIGSPFVLLFWREFDEFFGLKIHGYNIKYYKKLLVSVFDKIHFQILCKGTHFF